MASIPVYCLCGKPYDPTKFMIQCDACKEWFHGSCVGLYEHQSSDIEKYHCPKCEKMFGPSISKLRTNWHRHNYAEIDADTKAVQTGTPVFIKELKSRHFPSADDIMLLMRGHQLTLPYLVQNGFDQPILVENFDGLGLTVPPNTFSVEDVMQFLGPNFEVDAIDVTRQNDIRMTLNDLVRYYNGPTRSRVINVISLEFSNTSLAPLVEPPYIVNKLDWIQNMWPEQLPEDCPYSKPYVQKYCLIGVRDSYTDFHIDFGGTSVWYHVLRGEKVFFLIRPTQANLALYKRWMASANRSETFFGDQVDACYRCTVKQGQTLLIPTAWIHAVLTPVDSLVFGGNFLHSLNVPLQLQVYDIEKRIKTPEKFRFPWFETCNWYSAKHIHDELSDQNTGDRKPLPYLVQGSKALVSALKSWTQEKDIKSHKEKIPVALNWVKLIKDLAKQVRHAEKAPLNKKLKLRQLPPRDRRGRGMPKAEVKAPPIEDVAPVNLVMNKPVLHDAYSIPVVKKEIPLNDVQKPLKLCISKFTALEETSSAPRKKLKFLPANSRNAVPLPQTPQSGTNYQIAPSVSLNSNSETKRIPESATKKVDDSVYDFHDSEDDSLIVDESPPSRLSQRKNGSRKMMDYGRKQGSLKLKLSINGKSPPVGQSSVAVAPADVGENEPPPSSPKLGGIEELLLASGYATDEIPPGAKQLEKKKVLEKVEEEEAEEEEEVEEEEELVEEEVEEEELPVENSSMPEESVTPAVVDETFVVAESGRASPSTQEAIQGMLSMGRAVQFSSAMSSPPPLSGISVGAMPVHPSVANLSLSNLRMGGIAPTPRTNPKRKRRAKSYALEILEEEEFLDNCHQDAEFVYPSLEVLDEDGPIFKTRGRGSSDESWNPKARLVPNFPKPERPVREGVRKEAVESGLAAAAARLAHLPPPKRPYHKRKVKAKVRHLLEKDVEPKPGTSSQDPNMFDPMAPLTPKGIGPFKGKKAKKGFATAKQRLGRILKIHKMIH